MLFNSLTFALFFLGTLLLYPLVPRKTRAFYLLCLSLLFYMSWNVKYILLMLTSITITYICGILIGFENTRVQISSSKKKWIVAIGFTSNLLILALFKYFNFFIDIYNTILSHFFLPTINFHFDALLPVGISFYTFQALSYIVDVYRSDVKSERNFIKYALFVSFFPQLVAGPIERSKNLLTQIDSLPQQKRFRYDDFVHGSILMLWGYFMKMIVADRAAILVNHVYASYWLHGFFGLTTATFFFAIQIYCDFAAYSTIAIGAARILGFHLMENFSAPYFARSVGEFWRRWHISLSTWFRDYLYIPLGGNRVSRFRRNLNTSIVFLVSGVWHGAGLNFLAWGGLWAFFMLLGNETKAWRKNLINKYSIRQDCFSFGFGQWIFTFLLTCFAWIFFRSPSIADTFLIIKRMASNLDIWSYFNGTIYELGLSRPELNILITATIIICLVDFIRYRKNKTIDVFLLEQNLWFQWGITIALVLSIFIFGMYGFGFDPQQFIYFTF